jgi:L-threonylcarbamoyladenylate synthase
VYIIDKEVWMVRCLKVDSSHPDAAVLQEALAVLRQGGVVAYPTDTVYGLAVDAMRPQAVARLYDVKRRSPEKAIPLIVGGLDQLSQLIAPPSCAAKRMMAVFWPGPLTLLIPAHEQAPQHLLGDGRRIGVRWPQMALSQQLAYVPLTSWSSLHRPSIWCWMGVSLKARQYRRS